MATADQIHEDLAEFVSQFYADPLGFVLACFPWGEEGPLGDHDGPDKWQRDFLLWLGNEVTQRRRSGASHQGGGQLGAWDWEVHDAGVAGELDHEHQAQV
jgi:hypothetical protein